MGLIDGGIISGYCNVLNLCVAICFLIARLSFCWKFTGILNAKHLAICNIQGLELCEVISY